MLRKIALLLFYILPVATVYSQGINTATLIGRWRPLVATVQSDMVFLNDTTAQFVSSKGLICGLVNYRIKPKKDQFEIKYTFDIKARRKRYIIAGIKLTGDSTFLFRRDGSIPANAKAGTKHVIAYNKVKSEATDSFRLPTYSDLIGHWQNDFKGALNDNHIIFKDSVNVIFKHPEITEEFSYKVNFNNHPITVDFYNAQKKLPAFIQFVDDNTMNLEIFPNQNRGDHFTTFGHNFMMKKLINNH